MAPMAPMAPMAVNPMEDFTVAIFRDSPDWYAASENLAGPAGIPCDLETLWPSGPKAY